MKLLAFKHKGQDSLGYCIEDEVVNLTELGAPSSLDQVLAAGPDAMADLTSLAKGASSRLAMDQITHWLPPVANPSKAIAIGLNYVDHVNEGKLEIPEKPVIFTRFPTSWVGHNTPIIKPKLSHAFDYEGELTVVIGKAGRYISKENALDHVAGYSVFNEGSVRDYQFMTHQWTLGKIFDRSGGFGPCFVSADDLPLGASGLKIQTRLNGELLQDANTKQMIFDVATLISFCSEAVELRPGDIIIAGTPEGVGGSFKPPKFMQPGDVCEVSIEGIGVLSNPVEEEK